MVTIHRKFGVLGVWGYQCKINPCNKRVFAGGGYTCVLLPSRATGGAQCWGSIALDRAQLGCVNIEF